MITGNYIDDDAAKHFADALRINSTLTTIEFSGTKQFVRDMNVRSLLILMVANNIGDEGVKLVANALEENETLTSINLCREFGANKAACKRLTRMFLYREQHWY